MPWQTMKHQEVTPEILAHRQQAGMAMKASLLKDGFPEDRVDVIVDATIGDEIWLSDKYQVAVRRRTGQGPFDATEECFNGFTEKWGEAVWLSIKRLDKAPMRDWRELQRIKNDILGPESEAIEIYPAESRLMDTANQTHLFALHHSFVPFGFTKRAVRGADGTYGLGGKQREPESVGLTDGHRRAKPGKNRNR